VLVEGLSDRAKTRGNDSGDIVQLTGRTPDDRIVVFDGNTRLIGEIIPLAIYDVSPHTLFGAVVTSEVGCDSGLPLQIA
jgi:tRNA A37 methylthiotransferase MiaB